MCKLALLAKENIDLGILLGAVSTDDVFPIGPTNEEPVLIQLQPSNLKSKLSTTQNKLGKQLSKNKRNSIIVRWKNPELLQTGKHVHF